MMNVQLYPTDYTVYNALAWGNCQKHYKLALVGPREERIAHAVIATLECFPLIGQVFSLFEYALAHLVYFFDESSGQMPPVNSDRNTKTFSVNVPMKIEDERLLPLLSPIRGIVYSYLPPVQISSMQKLREFSRSEVKGQIYGLDLTGIKDLKDKDLEFISRNFPKITHLIIRGYFISDAGLAHLEGLKLEHFSIVSYGNTTGVITDTGLAYLQKMPLTHLRILGSFSDKDLLGFSHLKLSSLSFGGEGCTVTNVGLQVVKNMPLEELEIIPSPRTMGITSLESLRDLNSLKVLKLQPAHWLRNEHLESLQNLQIEHLELCACKGLTDEGLRHLEKMPLLKNLIITLNNRFTDAGMVSISHLNQLQRLSIDSPRITRIGIEHIQELPLTHLSMGGRLRINDDDLALLSQMPLQSLKFGTNGPKGGFRHLKELPITNLTLDAIVTDLTELSHFKGKQLQVLHIFDVPREHFTREIIYILRDLKLKHLNVGTYRFSQEYLDILREDNPDLHVTNH